MERYQYSLLNQLFKCSTLLSNNLTSAQPLLYLLNSLEQKVRRAKLILPPNCKMRFLLWLASANLFASIKVGCGKFEPLEKRETIRKTKARLEQILYKNKPKIKLKKPFFNGSPGEIRTLCQRLQSPLDVWLDNSSLMPN